MRKLLLALLCLPLPAFAADIHFIACTSDTTTTPNASAAFTPTAGRLGVVTVTAGSTADTLTATSSVGGQTYSIANDGVRDAFAGFPGTVTNSIQVFVADQVYTAVSQTVTMDDVGDPSTGTNICVYELSGMSKVGNDAILQVAAPDNDNSSGATPTNVFDANVLTGNPTLQAVLVGHAGSGVDLAEAVGWTDTTSTIFHNLPDYAIEVWTRSSGFTSDTITGGGTYGASGGAIAVEFDASADGATFTAGPSQVAVTTTTVEVSFTSDTDGTVEGVACANGSGTPTDVEILADQCSGGGAAVAHFDEAVTATIADGETFTGLLPGTTYDTFYVIDAADDSAVVPLADQTTTSTAFTAGPSNNGVTSSTIVVSFTTNISGTVEGVACPDGETAPTAVQVLADQCTGDVAAQAHFDETVVVDIADGETFTGLAASTTYDTHYVIDATVDSGVVSLANQTTSGVGAPTFTSGPTETPLADGYTIAGTITCTGTCTVEAVACAPADAAPTSTEIEAGQCGGGNAALMNASEVWTTGVANDFALTSANKPPRLSVYVSGTDGSSDTAVTSLTSQDRSPRSGFAIQAMTSIAPTSILDLDSYFSPEFEIGGTVEYEDDTNEEADCNVSFEADGDFVLTPVGAGDCDGKRTFNISYQNIESETTGLFDAPAVGNFTTDDLVCNGNSAPEENSDPEDQVVLLSEDQAMDAIDLAALFLDDDGDTLTITETGAGTVPTGTTIASNGAWTGTPTTEDEAGQALEITATDECGDSDSFDLTVYVVNTWIVPDLENLSIEDAEDAIVEAAPWRAGDPGMSVTGYSCGTGQTFLHVATQEPEALTVASGDDLVEVEIVGAIMPDLEGMTEEEAIAAIEALCP